VLAAPAGESPAAGDSSLHDRIADLRRGRADEQLGFGLYTDHTDRAKGRMLAIQHTPGKPKRMAAYWDLLKVAERSVRYAERRDPRLGDGGSVLSSEPCTNAPSCWFWSASW